MMPLVGIDPGATHTGWAFREGEKLNVGSMIGKKGPHAVACYLQDFIPKGAIVAVERASLWGGGQGFSRARGAASNLEFGAYLRGFLTASGHKTLGVHAATWKGGTPKDALHARLHRKFPDLVLQGPRSGEKDALDALGILLWLEGLGDGVLELLD